MRRLHPRKTNIQLLCTPARAGSGCSDEKNEQAKKMIMERVAGYMDRAETLKQSGYGGPALFSDALTHNAPVASLRSSSYRLRCLRNGRSFAAAPKPASFIDQAVAIVADAINHDRQGDYEEALVLYKRSLDLFMEARKYEKNKATHDIITERCGQYMERAEELKGLLASGAGGGGSCGGVEGKGDDGGGGGIQVPSIGLRTKSSEARWEATREALETGGWRRIIVDPGQDNTDSQDLDHYNMAFARKLLRVLLPVCILEGSPAYCAIQRPMCMPLEPPYT